MLLALVVSAACARPAPPPSPTATPPTTASVAPTSAPARTNSDVRYVDVSVATVWTLPTSARAVDASALQRPADPRGWLAHLTNAQKLDLVGRVQTQSLYGTRVIVTGSSGTWSHVVLPDQPSQKDARGYPGWMPTVQLTSTAPRAGNTVRISSPTARVGSLVLSYGTTLPVVSRDADGVAVQLLDGTRATIASQDVSSSAGSDVLAEAKKFLGLPYMWGGTSGFGFDCSGFTELVYRSVGISLARDTDQQIKDGRAVALRDVRPGDLLFVADSSGAIVHEAIYAGDNRIIESPSTGSVVRIVALSTHRYVGARRVLPG